MWSLWAGSAAAALLLADRWGRLRFTAASTEPATALEVFGAQAGQGPCQDVHAGGRVVIDADLSRVRAAARWPVFVPRALGLGYYSVHAFPLRRGGQVIGALGLLGDRPGGMTPGDVEIVQTLGDVVTTRLLHERAARRGGVLTGQPQEAWGSRAVIEQAKGALASVRGTTVDEALEAVRSHARRHRLRLGGVAAAVITDPTSTGIPAPGERLTGSWTC